MSAPFTPGDMLYTATGAATAKLAEFEAWAP